MNFFFLIKKRKKTIIENFPASCKELTVLITINSLPCLLILLESLSDIAICLFLDFLKWRKCQALLKFKKQEREYLQAQGEESYSSDEVF